MTAIFRTAKYLFLAYALAVAAWVLSFEPRADPAELFGAALIFAWVVGPALLAAACVRLSHGEDGALGFLVAEMLIVLLAAMAWFQVVMAPDDPLSAGLIPFVLPFFSTWRSASPGSSRSRAAGGRGATGPDSAEPLAYRSGAP